MNIKRATNFLVLKILDTFVLFFSKIQSQIPENLPWKAKIFGEVYINLSHKIDSAEAQKIWKQSLQQMWMGDYLGGKKKRFELMSRVIEQNLLPNSQYVPDRLHPEWTQAIGHIGHLLVYMRCVKEGVIPKRDPGISIIHEDWMSPMSSLLLQGVKVEKRNNHTYTPDLISVWHQYDRLFAIRDKENFCDYLDLHERFFSSRVVNPDSPLVSIPESVSEYLGNLVRPQYRDTLENKYIAFHLRHKSDSNDARMCNPKNYLEAIKRILNFGYKVVIFGDTLFDLPVEIDSKNILDMRSTNSQEQILIPYILSKSSGLLTTHSGPAPLAWSLGIPVLTTNCVHINYFALSASQNSFYLPKRWMNQDNVEVNLKDVMKTKLGDWGWTKRHPNLNGHYLEENSSEELALATEYFLQNLNSLNNQDNSFSRLDSFRERNGLFGRGKIIPTFYGKSLDRHLD